MTVFLEENTHGRSGIAARPPYGDIRPFFPIARFRFRHAEYHLDGSARPSLLRSIAFELEEEGGFFPKRGGSELVFRVRWCALGKAAGTGVFRGPHGHGPEVRDKPGAAFTRESAAAERPGPRQGAAFLPPIFGISRAVRRPAPSIL
jgi:hypothetical protein